MRVLLLLHILMALLVAVSVGKPTKGKANVGTGNDKEISNMKKGVGVVGKSGKPSTDLKRSKAKVRKLKLKRNQSASKMLKIQLKTAMTDSKNSKTIRKDLQYDERTGLRVWNRGVFVFIDADGDGELYARITDQELFADLDLAACAAAQKITKHVGLQVCSPICAAKSMEPGGSRAEGNFKVDDMFAIIDADGAVPVCLLNIIVSRDSNSRPLERCRCLIAPYTHDLVYIEDLVATLWSGGNEKMGEHTFGSGHPEPPHSLTSGGYCLFQDNLVNVRNAQSSWSEFNNPEVPAFPCDNGPQDAVNGAYGPLSDAALNANIAQNIFLNAVGYGVQGSEKILVNVHFGVNYNNAYWSGSSIVFGDGDSEYYPLSSCVDVVAHEAAHAFSTKYANLRYTRQAGCVGESFSDMAAVMAARHMQNHEGPIDWHIGRNCTKNSEGFRNMLNPPWDGNSIDHVDDYITGMYFHRCSGILNKVFATLVAKSRWTVSSAFQLFAYANMWFWLPDDSFYWYGCDTVTAALYLSQYYSPLSREAISELDASFVAAGIRTVDCSDRWLSHTNCQSMSLPAQGADEWIVYRVDLPADTTRITMTMSGGTGDADLYYSASASHTVSLDYYDETAWEPGNNEEITAPSDTLPPPPAGEPVYVGVYAETAVSGVQLNICHI